MEILKTITIINKSLPTTKYRLRLIKSEEYTIYIFDRYINIEELKYCEYIYSCETKEEAERYTEFLKNQKLASK